MLPLLTLPGVATAHTDVADISRLDDIVESLHQLLHWVVFSVSMDCESQALIHGLTMTLETPYLGVHLCSLTASALGSP